MAINILFANNQADQLYSYIAQLRQAKSQMTSYKNAIVSNWQGTEVKYIRTGIDQTIAQIDNAIKQLSSLSDEIKSIAAVIKHEDDVATAAARAAALKQQRIQAAEQEYNASRTRFDEICNERELLLKQIKTATGSKLKKLKDQLNKTNVEIQNAQKRCDDCWNNLLAARR